MFKKMLTLAALASFVFAASASADMAADKAKVTSLVNKAVDFYKANGKEKTFSEISNPKGTLRDGDMYLFVWDMKGVVMAHGTKPNHIGTNMSELKDNKGVFFTKESLKIAAEKGEGWVDYEFQNPTTKKVEPKTSFVKKVDDYVFGCGIYKK